MHNLIQKKAGRELFSTTALQKLGRTTANMLLDVTAAWERQTVGRGRRKVIQNYVYCL